MKKAILIASTFLLMAMVLGSCSPYRVHKRPSKMTSNSPVNFLDFRKASCGCH